MSSSRFRLIDDDADAPLTLFVRPDGSVTPDKETVKQILSNCSTMDINLMTMKKTEAGQVNITMDSLTYINKGEIEGIEDPVEMTELQRNLCNFRMDHDYTPFTSPSHVPSGTDVVDDLARTLSMLEEDSLDPQLTNEPLTKITKIVNGRKQIVFVNSKEKQRMINAGVLKEKPTEKMFKKPKPLPTVIPPVKKEEVELSTPKAEALTPVTPTTTKVEDPVPEVPQKPVQSTTTSTTEKKPPSPTKKDKKVKPPIPDDLALFSTPDIIRRVGKDSENVSQPAKISPELRSKSNAEKKRHSIDATPVIRRMSLDNKKLESTTPIPTSTTVTPTTKETSKPIETKDEQVSVQDFTESMSNSSGSTETQLEPIPSAEDIRAMIHSEGTKSFTISSVVPEAVAEPAPSVDEPEASEDAAAGINIDAACLDLNQSILENISTDLSEDILYKVAQSLVDNNTELQNLIDKSLTDGNLDVIASPASHLQAVDALDSLNVVSNAAEIAPSSSQSVSLSGALPQSDVQTTPQAAVVSGATQIIRPGGRIVVIPPIERPTTRSRNKKPPSTTLQTTSTTPKPVIKPLDDQHVSGEELDSSPNDDDDEDEDGESDDDPNKLWCICNQPHNNRFMICCDTCEEWYHGKCVNVTKAMGQTMEQQGKDWMCVYCKDPALKRPAAAMRRIRKASRTSTDSASTVKSKLSSTSRASSTTKSRPSAGGNKHKPPGSKDATPKGDKAKETTTATSTTEKKQSCVVCGKPSRSSSIYCSDNCILKHAQGVEKVAVTKPKSTPESKESESNLDKWLADTSTATSNSTQETVATPTAASNKVVKVLKSGGENLTQSKLKIVKNANSQGVSLAVQKKGVSIGVLPHLPKTTPNNKPPVILNATLKNKHNAGVSGLKIVSKQAQLQLQRSGEDKTKSSSSPSNKSASSSTSTTPLKLLNKTPAKTPGKKESPLPQKTPKARAVEGSNAHKPESLRDNVRKTFFEQLSNRLKEVTDLKLTDDELREVSDEIESQLYRCFADTGQKYRNKYRSLIFNIKDPKNQTLWRRICEKSVNPYQLVRLSPDDLASQELALWRERETKHQLDMIKKSELELLNCSRQYVFKTHKGETVFEDDRSKDQVQDVPTTDTIQPDADDVPNEDKKKRDKDRKSSRDKDGKRRSKSKDRKKRSRSRDRSRHSDRRRSRSRDRHRDRDRERRHKSSRHRKDEDKKDKPINTEKLDKKSKEILEQLVDKQIVPPLEDKLWKTEEVIPATTDSVVPVAMPESDSDHEPSSTVTIPTPPRVPEPEDVTKKPEDVEKIEKNESPLIPEEPKGQEALWSGLINMIDVAHIAIHAYEVTGDCAGLGDELPTSGHLDIVGRIAPDTVWDYIDKMKATNGKSISVLRLTPTTMDERKAYLSLYSYLSSRQRLGVVKCENKRVKDFYILPLAANSSIPRAIAPITGPGFGESRPSLLVGIIVRDKRKRAVETVPHSVVKRVRVEIVPARTAGTPPPPPASTSRSYTPPPSLPRVDPRVKLPVPRVEVDVDMPEENEEDMDEPYSPADSDPDSQEPVQKLDTSLLTASKSTSFLDSGINSIANTAFEPFANKFDGIPGLDGTPSLPSSSLELEQKMAELDQKIAAQKAEIDKVSKDLVCSSSTSDLESSSLANIALPSNLQQILESIKGIGNKGDTPEYQPETPSLGLSNSSTDLTIPLMLPKLSSRTVASNSPSSDSQNSQSYVPIAPSTKPDEPKPPGGGGGGVLSSLSEEDLIKKAAEMLGEVEPPSLKRRRSSPPVHVSTKKARLDLPPIPGLED